MKLLSKLKGMGKAVKRFAEGGEVEADPLEMANNSAESQDIAASVPAGPKAEPEAPAKKSFKEAFAENRKAGNKTFEWEGKKYGTELAGESTVRKKVGAAPTRSSAPDTGDDTARMAKRGRNPDVYARMRAENRADSSAASAKRDSDRAILRDNIRKGNTGEVDSKTLLPVKRANGGLVKLGGLKSHGKAC